MPLAVSSSGITLSLLTAGFWAVSPLCMASAGRRIGSFPVVLLRIALAGLLLLALLPVYAFVSGSPLHLPTMAQFGWLAVSGLAGMAVGDALVYESLVTLGPRRATQIQIFAPVASALLAWLWMGEALPARAVAGIALVLGATFYAVLADRPNVLQSREPGRISLTGITLALAGAVCVGVGAVTARQAFNSQPPLDATVATAVRVNLSAICLWAIPLFRGQGARTVRHLGDRFVLGRLTAGTLLGPFGGMICYILALKRLEAGLVSTLVAMSPLLILPVVAMRYRSRIGWDIALAALVAAGGVAMIVYR